MAAIVEIEQTPKSSTHDFTIVARLKYGVTLATCLS